PYAVGGGCRIGEPRCVAGLGAAEPCPAGDGDLIGVLCGQGSAPSYGAGHADPASAAPGHRVPGKIAGRAVVHGGGGPGRRPARAGAVPSADGAAPAAGPPGMAGSPTAAAASRGAARRSSPAFSGTNR